MAVDISIHNVLNVSKEARAIVRVRIRGSIVEIHIQKTALQTITPVTTELQSNAQTIY